MKSPVDSQFVHDISQLDSLRQKAVSGKDGDEKAALRAAAEQFESLFTQMLFKSMREANEAFESDLIDNRTSKFYEQMADEQLASELSREGSLGLADMIVQQLGSAQSGEPQTNLKEAAFASANALPMNKDQSRQAAEQAMAELDRQSIAPPSIPERPIRKESFDSPESFVQTLTPHARRAARALGTDPAIILAQAALETGWGKKVIANARDNSHNLFNIKADKRWQGDKVATQTLEVYDGIPVQETASFRAYPSYQDSFDDFVSFLNSNPRYQQALSQSAQPEQFIRELHQAGYATDPDYSNKVLRVLEQVRGIMDQ
ncbi:flagellar assembly peptidoglycan hydrolase FlgJ [Salinivibrio sp. SS2]|uniref:flagellar assembly peptidoglycan hydrolase FlgJ n=1 Tax=Salinivibrio sp. SS2 TaxID=1892894 RepID=UPI00084C21E4|nr:flagellar assembly peptidoglycan hydrolase FlgJ [Salinivibrio sp. DV]ODP99741.1 flagellar rod assembly protein/muramidase FlgJ [Salinivibrio sp. DV]